MTTNKMTETTTDQNAIQNSKWCQATQQGGSTLMTKPVVLIVEPDDEILWAIKDDLQRQYEDCLQVLHVDSDTMTFEMLKQLKECKCVTLLVVEQQKSQMTGIDFFKTAMEWFPKAKRVLITVHDTNDASVRVPLQKAVVV